MTPPARVLSDHEQCGRHEARLDSHDRHLAKHDEWQGRWEGRLWAILIASCSGAIGTVILLIIQSSGRKP